MTAALSLTLWRFAAASAGSVVFAWLLSAVLHRAARRWPALAAHRSVWLLGQAAVALVFLCALAPLPRAGLAPALPLPRALAGAAEPVDVTQAQSSVVQARTAMPGAGSATDTATALSALPAGGTDAGHSQLSAAGRSADVTIATIALHWLPVTWLICYLAGLAWTAVRRLASAWRWQRALLRHSRVLATAELAAWPGFTALQLSRIAALKLSVRTTGLAVSPAMLGLLRPCLVLPGHLQALAPAQQTMIIEHELTHWRRRDGAWLAASGLAGLLFWFNRPVQRLHAALGEAVELGCDDVVLTGRAQRERQTYAAALVAQLRLQLTQQHHTYAAPAFGQIGIRERVLRMRELRPPRLARGGRLAIAAAAIGLATLGAALQPALSSPAPSAAARMPQAALPTPTPQAWRYPLAQPRVSSLYGVRSPQRSNAHHGIDFAARRGTPVTAVADGIVAEAGADERLGNYVRLDHGGGRQSLMAHLDRIAVRTGEHIAAGQTIGAAGATGKATGPHLHLEYWQDGHRRNPELVLAGLPAHATPRALAQRKAQGFPIPDDE
jgi:murein DD-endopeptidase MepM/ murein hydrolase activator NlpD